MKLGGDFLNQHAVTSLCPGIQVAAITPAQPGLSSSVGVVLAGGAALDADGFGFEARPETSIHPASRSCLTALRTVLRWSLVIATISLVSSVLPPASTNVCWGVTPSGGSQRPGGGPPADRGGQLV